MLGFISIFAGTAAARGTLASMINNMQILKILIFTLLTIKANSQSFSKFNSDTSSAVLLVDSLLYNVDVGDYESLRVKSTNEKKHDIIDVDVDQSELSLSLPVIFENNLILLKNNGQYYAVDINTKIRNRIFESELRMQKLNAIIVLNEKLCGYQRSTWNIANGRLYAEGDKFYTMDSMHKWKLDTGLKSHMFIFLNTGIFNYKDDYLSAFSVYSHYRPNTIVQTADNVRLELYPFVNSIVKGNEFYFALTNREFMTMGPSIFQLSKEARDNFHFVEKYQVLKTAFITSFNINSSIIFLCRKGNENFLCEFDSGHFYYNSRFPESDKLAHYTYKVVNQRSDQVLLISTSEHQQHATMQQFYMVEKDRIINFKLKDH